MYEMWTADRCVWDVAAGGPCPARVDGGQEASKDRLLQDTR